MPNPGTNRVLHADQREAFPYMSETNGGNSNQPTTTATLRRFGAAAWTTIVQTVDRGALQISKHPSAARYGITQSRARIGIWAALAFTCFSVLNGYGDDSSTGKSAKSGAASTGSLPWKTYPKWIDGTYDRTNGIFIGAKEKDFSKIKISLGQMYVPKSDMVSTMPSLSDLDKPVTFPGDDTVWSSLGNFQEQGDAKIPPGTKWDVTKSDGYDYCVSLNNIPFYAQANAKSGIALEYMDEYCFNKNESAFRFRTLTQTWYKIVPPGGDIYKGIPESDCDVFKQGGFCIKQGDAAQQEFWTGQKE
jgi:hypothetical protein